MKAEGGRLKTQSDLLKDATLPVLSLFLPCCERNTQAGNNSKTERFLMTDGFRRFGSTVAWSQGIGQIIMAAPACGKGL